MILWRSTFNSFHSTRLHHHFISIFMHNESKKLMYGKQVIKQIKTSHQHIIIKHIDRIYKWKPIMEKATYYYCSDAKASSNSLSQLIFCRLQPTRGYFHKFCKLQLARKLQLPSIFRRHQPTGGSYLSQLQLTSIKLQLDREIGRAHV